MKNGNNILKKILACALIIASTAWEGNYCQNVSTANQKALASNENSQQQGKITEGDISLPTGGVKISEETISKKDLEKIPAFTGDAEQITLNGDYVTSDWNKSDKVTYGCSNYGYKKLTTNQQTAYLKLLHATAGINLDGTGDCFMANADLKGEKGYSVKCPDGVNINEMKTAYAAFYNDHPEFYWLTSRYATSGLSLIVGVDALYDTKAERNAIDTKIKAADGERAALLSAYNSGHDEYGKMIALHNQIMRDFTYAYSSGTIPEKAAWAHNIVGALSGQHKDSAGNNKVVCEGYAKTFQYILNIKEIDNLYVIGNANGGGHAWNVISIGNKWYYMDLTWDDQKDGYGYTYTCMPASLFEQNHKAFSEKSSFWQYNLPEVDDTIDLSHTYFGRYNAYATPTTCSDVQSFIQQAGASSPNDDLVIMASSVSLISGIAKELELRSYTLAPEYKGYVVFVAGGAAKYKVKNPATSLTIDKTSHVLDVSTNPKFQLTFSTDSGSDDYVYISLSNTTKVSLDNRCIPIINGKATVTITGQRNGDVTITGKPLVGNASAVSCQVTVTGCALSQTIYTDSSCTVAVEKDDPLSYVNGAKIKNANNISVNKKTTILYTNMDVPTYLNRRNKLVKGKIIVGITSSEQTPTINKGKISTDAATAKIAKASISKNKNSSKQKITVTAQKDTGTVYLWIIGLGENNAIVSQDYCPVTIKAAPSKLILQDESYDSETASKYTSTTASINEPIYVYLNPTYTDSGKHTLTALDSTFTASLGNDNSYAKIEQISGFGYRITGTALKNGKSTTIKATFTCNENKKKAIFSLKFTNPVTSVQPSSLEGKSKLVSKGDRVKIKFTTETAGGNNIATTDKARVYITNGTASNGMAVVSKSNKYKSTISENEITLTLQKPPAEEATIYILYKDSTRKTEIAYQLASIDKNGNITLAEF